MTAHISKWSCPFCLTLVPRVAICVACGKAMTSDTPSRFEKGKLAANPTDWAVWARSESVGKFDLQVEPEWIATLWEGRRPLDPEHFRLKNRKSDMDACLVRSSPIPLDFPLRGCETEDGLLLDVHVSVALCVDSHHNACAFVINMAGNKDKPVSLNDIRRKYWQIIRNDLLKTIRSYPQAAFLSPSSEFLEVLRDDLKKSIGEHTQKDGLSVAADSSDPLRFYGPRPSKQDTWKGRGKVPAAGCDWEETVARELLARMTS